VQSWHNFERAFRPSSASCACRAVDQVVRHARMIRVFGEHLFQMPPPSSVHKRRVMRRLRRQQRQSINTTLAVVRMMTAPPVPSPPSRR